jgi:cell division protein FtsQ
MKRNRINKKNKINKKKTFRVVRLYLNWLKIFLVLGFSICMGCFFYFDYHNLIYDKIKNLFYKKTAQSGFQIKQIILDGRKNCKQELILSTVNVVNNQPIFSCDLNQIKSALEKIDWIKNTVVERKLPDIIKITIKEREPIALWQNQKKFFMVDSDGVIINFDESKNLKNLPVLVGPEAPLKANGILSHLEKYPEIKKKIIAMTFVRKRRWNLHLEGNVIIKLPETEVVESLKIIDRLISLNKIVSGKTLVFDLRGKDHIFVELNSEEFARISNRNKGRIT